MELDAAHGHVQSDFRVQKQKPLTKPVQVQVFVAMLVGVVIGRFLALNRRFEDELGVVAERMSSLTVRAREAFGTETPINTGLGVTVACIASAAILAQFERITATRYVLWLFKQA